MTDEESIRFLKHQATLMSAALHSIVRVLADDQKAAAFAEFEQIAQYAQAHLEASAASEKELSFFVALRASFEKAMAPNAQNQEPSRE